MPCIGMYYFSEESITCYWISLHLNSYVCLNKRMTNDLYVCSTNLCLFHQQIEIGSQICIGFCTLYVFPHLRNAINWFIGNLLFFIGFNEVSPLSCSCMNFIVVHYVNCVVLSRILLCIAWPMRQIELIQIQLVGSLSSVGIHK